MSELPSLSPPYVTRNDNPYEYTQQWREQVVELFRGVTMPGIALGDTGEVVVPPVTSIQIGQSTSLVALLGNAKRFKLLPVPIQKAVLDILFIILRRSVYDVVRFQSYTHPTKHTKFAMSFTKVLFTLLARTSDYEGSEEEQEAHALALRIVRLIGLTAPSGLSTRDVKSLFAMLDEPSPLSLSILQALKTALKPDTNTTGSKASPAYFFNFGGSAAGLYSVLAQPFFSAEYQIFTWFRVEQFPSPAQEGPSETRVTGLLSPTGQSPPSHHLRQSRNQSELDEARRPAIFSILSAEFIIELFLERRTLVLIVSDCRTEHTRIRLVNFPSDGAGLRRGVWYHVSVKHTRARFPYLSSDELTVHVDHEIVFQKGVRLPTITAASTPEICVGRNFDGQIGPVYFMSEVVPQVIVDAISSLDSCKSRPGEVNLHGGNAAFPDLLDTITLPDRKSYSFQSKVAVCYHPARCAYGHALDIHADKSKQSRQGQGLVDRHARHARLGRNTFPSHLVDLRELLEAVGGIDAVLALFPRLLIPRPIVKTQNSTTNHNSLGNTTQATHRPTNTTEPNNASHQGTSSFRMTVTMSDLPANSRIDSILSAASIIDLEQPDIALEGSLSLLLMLLSSCLSDNWRALHHLRECEGIELIAYVLARVPPSVFEREDSQCCVVALLRLQSAVQDISALEALVTKRLLCNWSIWSRSPYSCQSSLLAVIVSDSRVRPDHYLSIVGVQCFLDALKDHCSITPVLPGTNGPPPLSATRSFKLSNTSMENAGGIVISPLSRSMKSQDSLVNASVSEASTIDIKDRKYSSTSVGSNTSVSRDQALNINTSIVAPAPLPSSLEVDTTSKLRNSRNAKVSLSRMSSIRRESVSSATAGVYASFSPEDVDEADLLLQDELDDAELLELTQHETLDVLTLMAPSPTASQVSAPDPTCRPFQTMSPNGRKHIRLEFLTIVLSLLQRGTNGPRESWRILPFLSLCNDHQLADEMVQSLLSLITECDRSLAAITEACGGVDEFFSFIIVALVGHDIEEIRYGGIRVLSHYCLRLHLLPPQLLTMNLRNSGRSAGLLSRAIDTLTASVSASNEPHDFVFMRRLHERGGLTLIRDLLMQQFTDAGVLTYAALLETILIRYCTKADDSSNSNSPRPKSVVRASAKPIPQIVPTRFGSCAIYFANQLLQELNGSSGTNTILTLNNLPQPLFFYCLPHFPPDVLFQAFGDLLTIIQFNPTFKETLCSVEVWTCLCASLQKLYDDSRAQPITKVALMSSLSLTKALEFQFEDYTSTAEPQKFVTRVQLLSQWQSQYSDSMSPISGIKGPGLISNANVSFVGTPAYTPALLGKPAKLILEQPVDLDVGFAVCLKVMAVLFCHSLRQKQGWVHLFRAISIPAVSSDSSDQWLKINYDSNLDSSFVSEKKFLVSNAVTSHLVYELTLSMRGTYADLKTNAKSNIFKRRQEASARLENLLATLSMASLLTLRQQTVVTAIVPDYKVGLFRLSVKKEYDGSQRAGLENRSEGRVAKLIKAYLAKNKVLPYIRMQRKNTIGVKTNSPSRGRRDDTIGTTVGDDFFLDLTYSWTTLTLAEGLQLAANSPKSRPSPSNRSNQAINIMEKKGGLFSPLAEFMSGPGNLSTSKPHTARRRRSSINQRSRALFGCKDPIEPIDRNMGNGEGCLILTLQSLQLFDSLFWPSETSMLRNCNFLKFALPSFIQTEKLDGSNKVSSVLPSIYFQVFRLCLSVLCTLSPLHPLATLNVIRLKALLAPMSSANHLPPNVVPIPNLLTVALHGVTVTLQRLLFALGPIYTRLGLTNATKLNIRVAGWDDEEQELELLKGDAVEEEWFYLLATDEERCLQANAEFESRNGFMLLEYLRACMGFLVSCVNNSWVRSYLKSLLDKSTFSHLQQLAEKAISLNVTSISEKAAKRTLQLSRTSNVPPTSEVGNSQRTQRSASIDGSQSDLRSNTGSIEVDRDGDLEFLQTTIGLELDTLHEVESGLGSVRDHDTGEPIFNSSNADSPSRALIGLPSNGNPPDNFSDSAYSDTNVSETSDVSGHSSFTFDPQLTNSFIFSGSTKPQPEVPSDTSKSDDVSDLSIVSLLRLLRDPYVLHTNLSLNTDVMTLLRDLEQLELDTEMNFTVEMRAAARSVQIAPQVNLMDQQSQEASSLLKTLSSQVVHNFLIRERGRIANVRLSEQIRSRQVACLWRQCFRTYDSQRSPWFNPADDSSRDIPGLANYELSRRCDSQFRRMVLMRGDAVKDHRQDSYFDNRQRTHADFLDRKPRRRSSRSSRSSRSNPSGQPSPSKVDILPPTHVTSRVSWLRDVSKPLDDEEIGILVDNDNSPYPNSVTGALTEDDRSRPVWMTLFPLAESERVVLQFEVSQITLEYRLVGDLVATQRWLYFHPREQVGGHGDPLSFESIWQDRRWALDRLSEIYPRRHYFRNCAVELFFVDSAELLFAFENVADVQSFYAFLRRLNSTLLSSLALTINPRQGFARLPWTELWRQRKISNYEYLMRVNIAAGRSFNDLSQYPVLPWILSDYTSTILDLNDPRSFRDLSKPMGALDAVRLQYYIDRYNNFDSDSPGELPFLYGSHYSTEAFVVYYLIRQEPFTSLAVKLQGGRFDVPDRLFFDLQRTWEGCSRQSQSDVKELLPEFYCCPEMFLNTNRLSLGELQEGGTVDHVTLPPWCNDAFDFVRQHREALESDYVSAHLHEWIDLIFGYKQRGPAAKEAMNIFHHLTYENAVDLDQIEDATQRDAIKAQSIHYGQTPSQIFTRAHPRRMAAEECVAKLFSKHDLAALKRLTIVTPSQQMSGEGRHGPAIAVQCSNDTLVLMNADFSVCCYRWSVNPSYSSSATSHPFTVRAEKGKVHPSAELGRSRDVLQRQSFIPLVTSECLSPGASPLQHSRHRKPVFYGGWGFEPVGAGGRDLMIRPSLSSQLSEDGQSQTTRLSFRSVGSDHEGGINHIRSTSAISQQNKEKRISGGGGLYDMFKRAVSAKHFSDSPSSSSGERSRFSNESTCKLPESSPTSPDMKITRITDKSALPARTVLLEEYAAHANSVNFNPATAMQLPLFCSRNVALVVGDNGYGRIVTCGFWDNAIRVHAVEQLQEVASNCHTNVSSFTCVEYGSTVGHTFVSGSSDGLCRVWILEKPALASAYTHPKTQDPTYTTQSSQNQIAGASDESLRLVCSHVLWGHYSPITALCYNSELELAVSGSMSGVICIHSVRSGAFVRSIDKLKGKSVDVLLLSSSGYLVTHSWDDMMLHLFWVNGTHIRSVMVDAGFVLLHCSDDVAIHTIVGIRSLIESMAVNGSSYVLVCGDVSGRVSLRSLWSLELLAMRDLGDHGRVTFLGFTSDAQHLLIGSEDGTFSVGYDRRS